MTFPVSLLLSLSSCLRIALLAAQSFPQKMPAVHCKFTPGETLRYLIQRDPYFYDPEGAIDALDSEASYQPPLVERLTETVHSVAADGTATLALMLTPEPGFEDAAHPQSTLTRTVTIAPTGRLIAVTGGALGDSPAAQDLLRGLPPPSAEPYTLSQNGFVTWQRVQPPSVSRHQTRDHDGMLLRTTRAVRSDQCAFNTTAGYLMRADSTLTISSSLRMTQRGRRGVADFGPVVPSVQVVQTLSLELQEVSSPSATP